MVEPACSAGDRGSIPGSGKIPWRRKWQATPVSLPGKFHGRRSLAGYRPQGRKESDTTGQLHFTSAVPRQECKERSLLDSVEFGGFWGTSPSWMSQALWEGGGGVGWGRQKGR